MKKKLSQRITSAFLVVVMVLLMIPLNVINIWADSNSDYEVPTTGHKLLSTYNALTGTDISAGSADIVSSIKIFNNDMLEKLFSEHSAYVPMYDQLGEVHQGSDLISFSNSAGVSLSSSVGANVGVEKLFKASTNHKFDLSGDFSYSKAVETYFYDYVVSVQKGYYSFDENLLKEIRNYENDYLRGSFINALTGEDGTTPEEFFAIYGTHIITRYTAGGVAGIYSSSTRTKESSTVELKTLYSQNSEASASAEGIDVGAKNALELQLKIKGEEESNKFETSQKVYAYGGSEAVAFKTDSDGNATEFLFQDWANSIDENNANVLVDKRLHLTPIWELLPDTGYEERIIDLTTYFIEKSEESDKIFYQKFGLENYEFDYSKDWLGFDNCQIITNEMQLNDIRDDLGGVYVLANDIVLSEYANWTPIGTKDEPYILK